MGVVLEDGKIGRVDAEERHRVTLCSREMVTVQAADVRVGVAKTVRLRSHRERRLLVTPWVMTSARADDDRRELRCAPTHPGPAVPIHAADDIG